MKEYVKQLAEKYNTVGIERTFETLAGKKITVKGGTYGWKIDQEKEAEQLTKDLESHKDVKREPIYSTKRYGTYSRLLGNTYADVDFSRQEVRFYRCLLYTSSHQIKARHDPGLHRLHIYFIQTDPACRALCTFPALHTSHRKSPRLYVLQ